VTVFKSEPLFIRLFFVGTTDYELCMEAGFRRELTHETNVNLSDEVYDVLAYPILALTVHVYSDTIGVFLPVIAHTHIHRPTIQIKNRRTEERVYTEKQTNPYSVLTRAYDLPHRC